MAALIFDFNIKVTLHGDDAEEPREEITDETIVEKDNKIDLSEKKTEPVDQVSHFISTGYRVYRTRRSFKSSKDLVRKNVARWRAHQTPPPSQQT